MEVVQYFKFSKRKKLKNSASKQLRRKNLNSDTNVAEIVLATNLDRFDMLDAKYEPEN